jgi:peptidoglycan hydrolase-like protein with peptidoglycan-binding domain
MSRLSSDTIEAPADASPPALAPARRRWQPRLSRRRLLVAGPVLAVLVGAILVRSGGHHAPPPAKATTATATVAVHDLVNREQVDGTLGYAPVPAALVAGRAGVLTAVPAEGAVVDRGQRLFDVDGEPIVLMFGATPAYRDLVQGMGGADVRELKKNLVAIGDGTWAAIGDDNVFSPATASALRRFQRTIGAEATGIVRLGDIAFLPGAVRVAAHKLEVGAAVSAGAQVTDISSATRVVTVQLDAAKQGLVRVGDGVVVTLPTGKSTTGSVSSIAAVAKLSGSGSTATTTVAVTVGLSHPGATGTIDQAPVKVGITTASAKGVLAVPVNALVALAEGGYGVEVIRPDGTHQLVGVTTGMFSDSDDLVQVRGGLKAGDTVAVSG